MQLASLNRSGLWYVAGVATAYFALAASAIVFTRLSHNVALLWMANAPLMAALLIRPAVERPWHVVTCFFASLTATLTVSPYASISPILAFTNAGEAAFIYYLLARLGATHEPFASLKRLTVFGVVAALIGPSVFGVLPAIALWFFQDASPLVTWSNWIVGHGLGAMIGTPVALLVMGGGREPGERALNGGWLRVTWVGALLLGTAAACFAQDGLPLLFLPILPLIIATMMFRLAGAALGVFAIAMIGAAFTVAGHGPIQLIASTEALHLQFFQFYLAALFLTAMPFATMIAEKNQLARAVAESEARYRLIAEYASDAVLVVDAAGDVLFASPAVRDVAGYEPEMLIGLSSFQFVASPYRDRVRAMHANALCDPTRVFRAEFTALNRSGVTRWYESTARAITDQHGAATSIVTIVRDLTHRKAREADLERQASTDSMTGVLNRRAFQTRLADVSQAGACGVGVLALLDLDHFKQVNDRFGHAAGDAALLTFADVMRSRLRYEDAIGRLGGEEFAILFPDLTPTAALAVCERVREALEETEIVTAHGAFNVTVSIGLSSLQPGMSPEATFRQADAALYRAKALGRNRSELADA